jgi:hypothetical protein
LTKANSEERIRERAYQLWKDAGEPSGRDCQFWEQAERSLAVKAPESDDAAPLPQTATDRPAVSRGGVLAFVDKLNAFLDIGARIKSYLKRRREARNARARSYCRQQLRSWYKAEFIAAADRKRYAKEFCVVEAHVHKYETIFYEAWRFMVTAVLCTLAIYAFAIAYYFPLDSVLRNRMLKIFNISEFVSNTSIAYIVAYTLLHTHC